jgi:hypothetical protein
VKDEETFCELVQQRLVAQGHPVEVVNGGVSGYSPTLEYVSLRDEFLAFEPDLVILWYDLGDLQEDHWFQKNLLYDADGRIQRCDPRYVNGRYDWWGWATRTSALAKYLNTKLLNTARKISILGWGGYVQAKLRGERSKVAIARLKAQQQTADLAAYDRFLLVRETATQESLEPYWQLSRRYLLMIRALLAERQIPFVLGIYPYGMLVGPDQWAEGRTFWGFEPGKVYEAAPARALFRAFAETEQIPLIDTFDSFRKAGAREKLFYDQDGHFTPAGHRVLADHLVRDPAFSALLLPLASKQNRHRAARP